MLVFRLLAVISQGSCEVRKHQLLTQDHRTSQDEHQSSVKMLINDDKATAVVIWECLSVCLILSQETSFYKGPEHRCRLVLIIGGGEGRDDFWYLQLDREKVWSPASTDKAREFERSGGRCIALGKMFKSDTFQEYFKPNILCNRTQDEEFSIPNFISKNLQNF